MHNIKTRQSSRYLLLGRVPIVIRQKCKLQQDSCVVCSIIEETTTRLYFPKVEMIKTRSLKLGGGEL